MTAFNKRKAEEMEESKRKIFDCLKEAGFSMVQGEQELQVGAAGGDMNVFSDKLARFVGIDDEMAGGPLDSEMIQLSFINSDSSGNSYIMPKGGICPNASRLSHKLTKSKNKLLR